MYNVKIGQFVSDEMCRLYTIHQHKDETKCFSLICQESPDKSLQNIGAGGSYRQQANFHYKLKTEELQRPTSTE